VGFGLGFFVLNSELVFVENPKCAFYKGLMKDVRSSDEVVK
jgi:hypothetical protein